MATGPNRGGTGWIVFATVLLLAAQPAWHTLDDLSNVDPSWMVVISQACREHWAFGRDIIFTFGPYGHLYCQTPLDALTTLPLNALAWACGLAIMWRTLTGGDLRHASWATAATGLVTFAAGAADINIFYNFLPLLFGLYPWACADRNARPARVDMVLMHFAAAVMAMLCLVKLTFTINCAIALLSMTAVLIGRRCKPWMLATFAIVLLMLWIAAGQTAANAGQFISTGVDIVLGYDAMSLNSPDSALREALLATAGALLTVIIAQRLIAMYGHWAWIGAGGAALQLALVFKASIVRHDVHVLLGVQLYTAAAVLITGMCGPGITARQRRRIDALAAIALMCTVAVGISHRNVDKDSEWNVADACFAPITGLPDNLRRIIDYPWTSARRHARWQASLDPVREQFPLQPVDGTIDIYLPRQAIAPAHNLNYHPRPVIQSYSAYTPRLLELNRRHLEDPNAPQWLVYQPFQVNSRYVWLNDSLSWPVILSHYKPARYEHGRLLLQRELTPRIHTLTPLGSQSATMGDVVTLPIPKRAEALWARLDLERTASDRVRSLVYKSRPVRIEVFLQDGSHLDRRLIPSIARAGFILSPCIEDSRQFAQMALSREGAAWTDRVVRAMRVRFEDDDKPTRTYELNLLLLAWQRPGEATP